MNCTAIIVGIDNWQRYTLPLIQSIQKHEPSCHIVVVDNLSQTPYPQINEGDTRIDIIRSATRLCYSAAINMGQEFTGIIEDKVKWPDWYIVLSNDVLCTGPFMGALASRLHNEIVGPCLKETPIPGYGPIEYLEGWCIAFSRHAWDILGGWDERFLGSDWEDVAISTKARQHGMWLIEDLPFKHLDQRQRYHIVPDFAGKDAHNRALFMREYLGISGV